MITASMTKYTTNWITFGGYQFEWCN